MALAAQTERLKNLLDTPLTELAATHFSDSDWQFFQYFYDALHPAQAKARSTGIFTAISRSSTIADLTTIRTAISSFIIEKYRDALLDSGFNPEQIETFRRLAKTEKLFIGERGRNPETCLTEQYARKHGEIVSGKPMKIKDKSRDFGGADEGERPLLLRAASAGGLATESTALTEEERAQEARKIFLKPQKSSTLESRPFTLALDDLWPHIKLGRLKLPLLIKQVTTVHIHEKQEGPGMKTSTHPETFTCYFLYFEFSEKYQTSKSKGIYLQIPEAFAGDSTATVKEASVFVSREEWPARLADIQLVNGFMHEASKTLSMSKGVRSQEFTPLDMFVYTQRMKGFSAEKIEETWQALFDDYSALENVLSHICFAGKKLRPGVETALLTVHRLVPERGEVTPWCAMQRYKSLPLPARGTIVAPLVSDADGLFLAKHSSAIGAQKRKEPSLLAITDFEKLPQNRDGEITGVGTHLECSLIRLLNEIYLQVLSDAAEKCGPGTPEKKFNTNLVAAQAILAHHGYEFLNPYATVQSARAAIEEGALIVTPDGFPLWIKGIKEMRAAMKAIAKMGHDIPMSAAFYVALNLENLTQSDPSISTMIEELEKAASAEGRGSRPSIMNTAQVASSSSIVAAIKAKNPECREVSLNIRNHALLAPLGAYRDHKIFTKANASPEVPSPPTPFVSRPRRAAIARLPSHREMSLASSAIPTNFGSLYLAAEKEKTKVLTVVASKDIATIARFGEIFSLHAAARGWDIEEWRRALADIPVHRFLEQYQAIDAFMASIDTVLVSAVDGGVSLSARSESPRLTEQEDFNQRWKLIWPKIVSFFADPQNAEFREDRSSYFVELFNLSEKLRFVIGEEEKLIFANLREGKLEEAKVFLAEWETFSDEESVSSADDMPALEPVTPAPAAAMPFSNYALSTEVPVVEDCRIAFSTILDHIGTITNAEWDEIYAGLTTFFKLPEGLSFAPETQGSDLAQINPTNLLTGQKAEDAKEYLEAWAAVAKDRSMTASL